MGRGKKRPLAERVSLPDVSSWLSTSAHLALTTANVLDVLDVLDVSTWLSTSAQLALSYF
jgi:hypothetical protein